MDLHPGPEKRRVPEAWLQSDSIRRALQENEDWYQDLVEHSQDLLCVHDLEGRLLSVNPAPARMLGYSVEEILQIPMRELIAPDFRSQFDAYLSQIERVGEAHGLLAVMTRSGERRIWEYHNTLRSEGVETPIVRGLAHDVTEQKYAEKLAREASENLRNKVSEGECTIRELQLFRSLVDQCNDAIEVVDPETLRFLDVNEKACSELGYSREELLSLRAVDINTSVTEASAAEIIEELRKSGSLVMEAVHRRKGGSTFPVELSVRQVQLDREYLVVIARDLTQHKLAEARLREYERVVEGLEERIMVVDREYRYVIANRTFLNYRGLEREHAVGHRVAEIIGKEVFEKLVKHKMDECFRGKVVQYELRLEFPKLGERDVLAKYFPIEGPNGIDRIACILRDITESKRAQHRLEEYERVVEAMDEVIVVIDRNYRYVIANRALLNYRGIGKEQIIGHSIAEVAGQEAFERVFKPKLDECFQGKVVRFDFRQNYPELGERDLVITYFPIEGPTGVDRIAAIVQDFTERKRAEEALRASERRQHKIAVQLDEERARLIEAQAVAKVGSWEVELPSLEITWSEQTHRIFETDPTRFHPRRPDFVEFIHPEDRAKVDAAFQASLDRGTFSSVEYRIVLAGGRLKVLEEQWRVFHDEHGRPIRLMGTCRDVTEHKRADEALRQNVVQLQKVTEELRLAQEKLSEEKLYLEEAIDNELGFGEIIGSSNALKEVMQKVAKVAPSDASVLLLGETGTGKELVARALHRMSRREGKSFIKMNCAAIPSGLLESELFGHEKGAFTGAVARKLGRLELADRGTLFLDEIGEIPLSLQPKLLRVLQDMEFERLGGTQTLKVDFRLLAATNRDLAQSVKAREFRSDLYYRLNVFPILIPPLRERREDIRPLVEHFVRKFAHQMKKSITSIPAMTLEMLVRWEWPGNIRELENFVERSVILSPGSVLQSPLSELEKAVDVGNSGRSIKLRDKDRERMLQVLRECHGKLGGPDGAAARLGLKRTTLQSKLDQLGIKPRAYRQ